MTSRERVACALRREEPDRVPFCDLVVDRPLARKLMGWDEEKSQRTFLEANAYTLDEAKAVAAHLGLDNLSFVLRAPVYADRIAGQDGRLFYGAGHVTDRSRLDVLKVPDPKNDALYEEAARFATRKDDYSAWFVTRIGIFPTMLSMGLEAFSIALHEDREFVEIVLDRYCDWAAVVAGKVCGLGFDVYVSTDDMAFKTAPYFSPAVFRGLVVPRLRKVAEKITLPWVVHSDGNIAPFLDDLVDLGIAGIHPLEKGAMDIGAIKRRYGDRLCLLGNVDLNLLGMRPVAEVEAEVRTLIRDVGPGGGYVLTSGNSLAGYLIPENVMAMAHAVRRYGRYPIRL